MIDVDLSALPSALLSEGTTRYVTAVDTTEIARHGLYTHIFYRFPNNYGASVICSDTSWDDRHSNGNFELAVLAWAGGDGYVDADNAVAAAWADSSDNHAAIRNHLSAHDVERTLLAIKRLPAPSALVTRGEV